MAVTYAIGLAKISALETRLKEKGVRIAGGGDLWLGDVIHKAPNDSRFCLQTVHVVLK